MLKKIKNALYPTLSRYFSNVTMVEGISNGLDQPLRCLFVDNSRYHEYLTSVIYEKEPKILRRGKIWNQAVAIMIEGAWNDADISVVVLPREFYTVFSGSYAFKGTKNIRQVIDLSGRWEEIRGRFSKSIRHIVKKIERSGFGFRLSRDLHDFEFFYSRMYVPHVKKQFGDLSIIDSYENIRQRFLKGFLLLITKGDEPVSGSINLVEDRTLTSMEGGVLDADEKLIKSGAQAADYYFMMRVAKEMRLDQIDLMTSSSILNDGVYKHKRGWGAAVRPDKECVPWVYYFIPEISKKTVVYFERNPVIVHSGEGLKVLAGLSESAGFSPEAKKRLFDQYYAAGLEGMILVTQSGLIELTWRELK